MYKEVIDDSNASLRSLTYVIIILTYFVYVVTSVANNLHTHDGTSSVDIINGDIFFEIVDPEILAYTYRLRPAKDFGMPFNESFSARNVALIPVEPPSGCGWPSNAEEVVGSVALVERGECSFLSKSVRMQEVGARAVIITEETNVADSSYIEMIADNTERQVNIPAGFLPGINGQLIKNTLQKLNKKYALINIPVNLTHTPIHKMNQPPWINW